MKTSQEPEASAEESPSSARLAVPRDVDGELNEMHSSRRQKRGGSWNTGPSRTRSAFRNTQPVDEREGDLGFRVCLDAW